MTDCGAGATGATGALATRCGAVAGTGFGAGLSTKCDGVTGAAGALTIANQIPRTIPPETKIMDHPIIRIFLDRDVIIKTSAPSRHPIVNHQSTADCTIRKNITSKIMPVMANARAILSLCFFSHGNNRFFLDLVAAGVITAGVVVLAMIRLLSKKEMSKNYSTVYII